MKQILQKALCFTLAIIFCTFLVNAQLPLAEGDVAVTFRAGMVGGTTTPTTNAVLAVMRTSNTSTAIPGQVWTKPSAGFGGTKPAWYSDPSWTSNNLGDVFGIAIDNYGNIIVSSTSIYTGTISNKIFQINGVTGSISTITPAGSIGSYGNIKFTEINGDGYLYFTDWGNGKIHCMKRVGNTNNSSWVSQPSFNPEFGRIGGGLENLSNGQIAYGLGIRETSTGKKLYYSRIGKSLDNNYGTGIANGYENEIWCVDIDNTGSLIGSSETKQTGEYLFGSTGTYYFNRSVNGTFPNHRNPIADIAFSGDGKRMLIAQQSMNSLNSIGAHASEVGEFTSNTSNNWVASGKHFPTGGYLSSWIGYVNTGQSSSTGGICYSNNILYQNSLSKYCDTTVWAVTDWIQAGGSGSIPANPVNTGYVYGLMGYKSNGIAPSTTSYGNALLIDEDDDYSYYDKYYLGDVETYKLPMPVCNTCACGNWLSNPTLNSNNINLHPSSGEYIVPINYQEPSGLLNVYYNCAGNCSENYNWYIKNNANSIITTGNIFPLDLSTITALNTCGTYTLVVKPTCDTLQCDSLIIKLKSASLNETTVNTCSFPYAWNGMSITEYGNYSFSNGAIVNGCENLSVLNLIPYDVSEIGYEGYDECCIQRQNCYNEASTFFANNGYNIADATIKYGDFWNPTIYTITTLTGCIFKYTCYSTIYNPPNATLSITNTVDATCTTSTGSFDYLALSGCGSGINGLLYVYNSNNNQIAGSPFSVSGNGTISGLPSGTYTVYFNSVTNLFGGSCSNASTSVIIGANNISTSSNRTITSCENYVWHNTTYNTSGTFYFSGVNANGCSINDTLNLTIEQPSHSYTSLQACDSITWHGKKYYNSGLYIDTSNCCKNLGGSMQAFDGSNTFYKTATLYDYDDCLLPYNNPVYEGGKPYQVDGHMVVGFDCDGIGHVTEATGNYAIAYPVGTVYNFTGLSSSSPNYYYYPGACTYPNTVYVELTDIVNSTSLFACCTYDTLILTINQPTSSTTSISTCNTSYTWNGQTYISSGAYTTSGLVNAAGCDSTAILVLTINQPTFSTATHTACDSYTWNGQTYTTSGTYATTNLINSNGCDSTATLILTIYNNKYSSGHGSGAYTCQGNFFVCQNCDNDANSFFSNQSIPINANGIVGPNTPISSPGTFTYSANNIFGCTYTYDCIISSNGINRPVFTNEAISNTTCGQANGAFSINITFNSICGGGSNSFPAVVNIHDANTGLPILLNVTCPITGLPAGNYYALDASGTGLDNCYVEGKWCFTIGASSKPTISLNTIQPTCNQLLGSLTASIIGGVSPYSYSWSNGNTTSSISSINGIFTLIVTDANGCKDTTTATIIPFNGVSTSSSTSLSTCNTSYSWNGQTYTSSGTYTKNNLVNSEGCDSTATLILTLNSSTSTKTPVTACDSYTWLKNNQTYTTSGIYTSNSTNAAGCPHVDSLVLTINYSTSTNTPVTACDTYTWNKDNQTYTTSGVYTNNSTNAAGCPHIDSLVLTINNSTRTKTPVTACNSYTWLKNNQTYTTSGIYTNISTNANGCPHIDSLVLTINNSTSTNTPVTACDTYTWLINNQTYTTSGVYTSNSTNAAGCPHIDRLVLTINNSTSTKTPVTACDSYTWLKNNQTYTTSSVYTSNSTNAAGCPHIDSLVLTINNTTSTKTPVTACDSYTWLKNNQTYTTSGIYTSNSTNAAGCPHIDSLVLTINNSSSSTTTKSVCPQDLPFMWNNIFINAANTYNKTGLFNVAGCDSTATLIVIVKDTCLLAIDSGCWKLVGSGYGHRVAIKNDGTLWAWGRNDYGQLGQGIASTTNIYVPVQIGTDNDWKTIAVGFYHNLAIKNNGKLYAWGKNNFGNFGNGTQVNSYIPIQIGSANNWVKISAANNSAAINSNGQLFVWGANDRGILGIGVDESVTPLISSIPTTPLLTNCKDVSCGMFQNIALKNNGEVYVWGDNTYNQLGIAGILNAYTPTFLMNNVKAISSGFHHGAVIKADGTLWTWGYNGAGQIGNGGTYPFNNQPTPLQISSATNWKQISAGFSNTGAIKTNGELWMCGADNDGQMANGSSSVPYLIRVGTANNWKFLNTGTAVIKTNGSLWTTGPNDYGQIGNGNAGGYSYYIYQQIACPCPATKRDTTYSSACDSIRIKGIKYTTSTTIRDTIKNVEGCDSIIKVNIVTIKNATSSSTTHSACISFTWNNTTYTTSGIKTFVTTNSKGCDSIANLVLTINQPTSSTITQNICTKDLPYTWNGQSITTASNTTVHFTNANGCDSTATLILVVKDTCCACNNQFKFTSKIVIQEPSEVGTNSADSIPCGYSYSGNADCYRNFYAHVLYQNPWANNACSTSVTGKLIKNGVVVNSVNNITATNNLTVNFSGSGNYQIKFYLIVNGIICDSCVSDLNITCPPPCSPTTSTTYLTSCDTLSSFNWNGVIIKPWGTYTSVGLTNAAGCDSIATLIYSLNSQTQNRWILGNGNEINFNTPTPTVTSGRSMNTWEGTASINDNNGNLIFYSDGRKVWNASNTLIATLNIGSTKASKQAATIAPVPGTTNKYWLLSIEDEDYTSTARGFRTLITVVSPTSITVGTPTIFANFDCGEQLCVMPHSNNINYWVVTTKIGTSNLYAYLVTNSSFSTSPIISNTLNINYPGMFKAHCGTSRIAKAQDGAKAFDVFNMNRTTGVINLNHRFISSPNPFKGAKSVEFSPSGKVLYGSTNNGATQGIIYQFDLVANALSYTSVTNNIDQGFLQLAPNDKIYLALQGATSLAAINNPEILGSGCGYTNTGLALLNASYWGLPSSIVFTRNCCNNCTPTNSVTNVSKCVQQLPFTWNNQTISGAGTTTAHFTNAAGCDSVATLVTTIVNKPTKNITVSICKNKLPYSYNGTNYSLAGTYNNINLVNTSGGCDTTVTLNLTITPNPTRTISDTVCNNKMPYVFKGIPYTTTGNYTITVANNSGCDSIITLVLSVKQNPTKVENLSICTSQLPYTFGGCTFTAAGSCSYSKPSITGDCDTIVFVNLATTNCQPCANCSPDFNFVNNQTFYKLPNGNTTFISCSTNNVSLICNTQHSFGANYINPYPSSCKVNDSAVIIYTDANGVSTNVAMLANVTATNLLNYTFKYSGNYCITHYLKVNGKVCKTCTTCFTVSCPCNCNQYDFMGNPYIKFAIGTYPDIAVKTIVGKCGGSFAENLNCAYNYKFYMPIATPPNCNVNVVSELTKAGNTTPLWTTQNTTSINPLNYTFISGGTYYITYKLYVNGVLCKTCVVSMTVCCNSITPSVPVITGTKVGCTFDKATFLNVNIPNGVWSSKDESIALVHPSAGYVIPKNNGTTQLFYSWPFNNCWYYTYTDYIVQAVAVPEISTTPSSSLCVGNTMQASNSTFLEPGSTSSWSTTGRATISNTGLITGTSGGSTNIRYTITNNLGCSNSSDMPFNVNAIPATPSIAYAAGYPNPQAGCSGGTFGKNRTFQLLGTPTNGSWSSTGQLSITALGLATTSNTNGAGSVTYSISNEAGCKSSRTITGTIGNCAGKGITSQDFTYNSQQFTIYPNPSNGKGINLKIDRLFANAKVFITDIYGKQVYTKRLSLTNLNGAVEPLNIQLAKGIYFVSLINNEEKQTQKLVVE